MKHRDLPFDSDFCGSPLIEASQMNDELWQGTFTVLQPVMSVRFRSSWRFSPSCQQLISHPYAVYQLWPSSRDVPTPCLSWEVWQFHEPCCSHRSTILFVLATTFFLRPSHIWADWSSNPVFRSATQEHQLASILRVNEAYMTIRSHWSLVVAPPSHPVWPTFWSLFLSIPLRRELAYYSLVWGWMSMS